MTSFTLAALSNQADIYTEMKWQPRPNVLSGLIRSAAFNANLLWIFHLSFIMPRIQLLLQSVIFGLNSATKPIIHLFVM